MKIDSSNLLAKSLPNTVIPAMEQSIRTWIPVGHDDHFLHRLCPKTCDLRPENDHWDSNSEPPAHVLAFQNDEGQERFAYLRLERLEFTLDDQAHCYVAVLPPAKK